MSYLRFDHVKKVFNNRVEAVKDFTLDIDKGEFVAFLGPSGCGKTTTLRMIAGLEKVTEGDIILEGKSIINLEPKDRKVSMIFQSYAVWPHMSVYGNIAYALKLMKKSKAEIDETVRDVARIADITAYLDRYPSQLSGGQRQRVAVARAIAVKPKLFLMDEPLSNLDAKLRVAMRTDLKRIHKELKSTSIFVTHDQSEALSLADRIVVMNDGVIEQIGTPNEIYHQSETMFIAKFIGSPPANFFPVHVKEQDGRIVLVHPAFKFPVQKKEESEALKDSYLGQEIILSVRPEMITINRKDALLHSTASIIEPQGSHVIINTRIGDMDVKIQSDILDIAVDQKIAIGFSDTYQLFDPKTERKII
ncbi:MAG: ABC transporter ATP-binding protein [Acholeplasmataceae bacterium]